MARSCVFMHVFRMLSRLVVLNVDVTDHRLPKRLLDLNLRLSNNQLVRILLAWGGSELRILIVKRERRLRD
jgi:hypothetical protein